MRTLGFVAMRYSEGMLPGLVGMLLVFFLF